MKKHPVLKNFWQLLGEAKNAVLLLDYDGTLAPFRVARDQAFPYPGVRELLNAIRRDTGTRLVIISGRAIDDLLPLLGLDPPPELWGCHGWERLESTGFRPAIDLPTRATEGLRRALLSMKDLGLDNLCEIKPASLALHWRGFSDHKIKQLCARVEEAWRSLAETYGLDVHPFNGGLELRCPGRDKGTAIRSILDDTAPGQPIAFLGDDRTDEDGFAALKGRGLGVLVNSESRETLADLQITSPEELLGFLAEWRAHAPAKQYKTQGD